MTPSQCPLLKRFYVLIDRHENFYSTYSGLNFTWWGSFNRRGHLPVLKPTSRY